jgi:hypothetical protein
MKKVTVSARGVAPDFRSRGSRMEEVRSKSVLTRSVRKCVSKGTQLKISKFQGALFLLKLHTSNSSS